MKKLHLNRILKIALSHIREKRINKNKKLRKVWAQMRFLNSCRRSLKKNIGADTLEKRHQRLIMRSLTLISNAQYRGDVSRAIKKFVYPMLYKRAWRTEFILHIASFREKVAKL